MVSKIDAAHTQAVARFNTLDAHGRKVAAASKALQDLTLKGQAVTQSDVFDKFMELIQAGHISPREVAGQLQSMPLQGPALAEYLARDQMKMQKLMQGLDQAHEQARQAVGMTALHKMMADSTGAPSAQVQPTGAPSNAA